jgi:hypothetical protein
MLRPDLERAMHAMRQQREQWAQVAGETLNIPRGPGKGNGFPTLARPCECHTPIRDDGTCIRCGRSTL